MDLLQYQNTDSNQCKAFWDQWQGDAEKIWSYVHKVQSRFSFVLGSNLLVYQQCAELDVQRHGDGCALDEVNAHRFLELLGETLTVMAMRERLRKTGALSPTERPKLVPITHYLLFK